MSRCRWQVANWKLVKMACAPHFSARAELRDAQQTFLDQGQESGTEERDEQAYDTHHDA